MVKLKLSILFIAMIPLISTAGSKELCDKETEELKKANQQVLQEIKNPEQYEGKTINVKAEIKPSQDGAPKAEIKEIKVTDGNTKKNTSLDEELTPKGSEPDALKKASENISKELEPK